MQKQTNYNAGIYVRLSQEDMRAGESLSIENQKLILTKYVHEQGWNLVEIYVDMYPPKMIQFNLSPPGVKVSKKFHPLDKI